MRNGMVFNAIELKLMETERGIPKGPISATLLKPLEKMIPYFMSSPWSLITAEGDLDMKYLKLRFALGRRDITVLVAAFMTGLVDLMDYLRENWPMLCLIPRITRRMQTRLRYTGSRLSSVYRTRSSTCGYWT